MLLLDDLWRDLTALVRDKHPQLLDDIEGVSEETTNGGNSLSLFQKWNSKSK